MKVEVRPATKVRRARHWWILAVLATALLYTFVLAGTGDAAVAYDEEELRFVGLINEYRQQNGLRPVLLSDTLAVAAEHHSKDMAEYGFFAHDTEGSSYYRAGSEPWDRMEAEGYRFNTFKGENLAVGYETAEEAMQAWKDSPSHNAAMLDGDYRVMGVARINAPGSPYGWYWTTDFGGHVDPSAHAPGKSPREPTRDAPEPRATPEAPAASPGDSHGRKDTGALDNGRMGKSDAWSQKARDGADLVHDDGYARLGGYHDGRDELRQSIRVGSDGTLVYDVRVKAGAGGDPDDTMVVRLTDAEGRQVSVIARYTGRDASSWEHVRADLSRYSGRRLFLSVEAATDGERMTTFYVDGFKLGS